VFRLGRELEAPCKAVGIALQIVLFHTTHKTPPKPPDRQMEPAAPHSAAVTMASWCPRGWGYLGIGNHSVLAMSVRSGDG